MDANELARQRASALHAEAVARGGNPWDPYAFACTEATRRQISVESTAPDAVQLDGARAVFIARDRLILHENVGSIFDRAFLVAHELGHADLGDDPDEGGNVEIVPARVAEAAPVGLDRVVDYGRKQRREVQMDLFAREFLLPRAFIRKLHLEDQMGASAIASRLGAPFDVVAQQLLDALLLPPVTVELEEQRANYPPNEMQRTAAEYRGGPFLLEAGPGTGKTQTLALRVEGLLAEGIDPKQILVLTFSNKAAGEMAERISRKHKEAAAAMWIGTFHAFGLDLVRRFHSELGLPKDPRLMDRTEAAELLEHEYPRLGLLHYRNIYDPTHNITNILAAISRAKDEVINETEYRALAQKNLQEATTEEEKRAAEQALEVATVYAGYEKLKRQESCIDFGDLVSLPVRLLESIPSVREHFRNLYQHVLIDEYQDVNRASVRLLSALCGDGRNLWAVGDVKQSIYRFRGASSFNVPRFGKEDFAGGKKGRLNRNYRSVPEIVAAFSSFAVQMRVGQPDSGLEADRKSVGEPPELRFVASDGLQTGAVADAIREMRKAGYRYRDQAVLCTGNEKLSALGQELERVGIPVLFLGSLFERPEIKDLFAFLTLFTDGRAMGLVRTACWPEFRMSMEDVGTLLQHLRDTDPNPGVWLKERAGLPTMTEVGRHGVEALAGALAGFDHQSPPWTVLATLLLDRTRMAAKIASAESVAERSKGIAIWQLMNFVRSQPSDQGLPIARLLVRVRRLLRLGDDRDLRQLPAAARGIDAVRLMTIHGAKGLEFPVVYIPGMNADTMPRAGAAPACLPPNGMIEGGAGSSLDIFRAGQAEEQECLFFVAISRARDRLFFFVPRQKSGRQSKPSSFLEKLGTGVLSSDAHIQTMVPPAPEGQDIPLAIEGQMQFDGHQLSLYESCPRRFFYTHVLRVGGRRSATMFMQMHEAVRTVFQEVIADIAGSVQGNMDGRLAEEFLRQGLADHGYKSDYAALATAMLRYFVSTREKLKPEAPTALRLTFGDEQVFVLPDDVLVGSDGSRIFRRIRTGHQRTDEMEEIGAATFVLAARQTFPEAVIELVHLSDETATPVAMTPKKLENRRLKIKEFLAAIRSGKFPAKPSAHKCSGCPAFFICGGTPAGTLPKKF